MGTLNVNSHVNANMQNQNLPQKGKKSHEFGNTTSILLTSGGYIGAKLAGQKLQFDVNKTFLNEVSKNHYLVNNKECHTLFKASNLKSLGVTLKNTDKNIKIDGWTQLWKSLKSGKFSKIRYSYKKFMKDASYNMAVNGNNACFNSFNNKIYVNCDKAGVFLPHEMGHAMNYNSKNPIMKLLTKGRYLQYLAPVILAVAIFRKPKQEGEESNSAIDKALDYVKENSTALTAACYAPTLIEEGLASIRGINFAKKYLSPEKIKAIKTTNLKAWGTYALVAGLAIGTVYIANKIRNATAPKTEAENNTKQNESKNLDKAA